MYDEEEFKLDTLTLEGWVMEKAEAWRDHYNTNYAEQHEEYMRLFRGIWDNRDKSRESERSRLIAPALQQAVESNVAEIEEATFGRGKFFDISDDVADKERQDVQVLRQLLQEEFDLSQVKQAISECILSAAIYGTGIGEIVIDEVKDMRPATRPIMEGAMQSVGVEIIDRVRVSLRPVMPNNFLIDPVATNIHDSVGIIIDEYVPTHTVELLQEQGVYNKGDFGSAQNNSDLEIDPSITVKNDGRTRITKYYGLVPTELVEDAPEDAGMYTEAIVIVANERFVLKASANPFMMQDRPVVAFRWDVVPNRFWGRGVCEKGYNAQKALDAELRARIDALGLTVHPMMAADATKLARGAKLEIKAGKTILTNGNPAEALMPFKFGGVDQVTFAQGVELQRMVQQATGAVDSTGVTGGINGEATAAGISMSLGAILKRHKRTLLNFYDSFLLRFVEKAAWRYMQFDPDRFPASDYKFVPVSTLGIVAREYEVTQLVQLLNTTPPDSPAYPLLVKSVIDNMNISNREEIIAQLEQANQPSPEQQAMAQQQQQMQMQLAQLEMQLKQAEVAKTQAEAQLASVKAQVEPQLAQAKYVSALSNNLNEDNESKDFERRMKLAELALKEKDIESNERIALAQMQAKTQAESKFNEALNGT